MRILGLAGIALVWITVLLSSARVACAQSSRMPEHHLMPVPASVKIMPGRLPIDRAFRVAVTKHQDARLLRGVERALLRLEARTGLGLQRSPSQDASGATLVIEVRSEGERVQSPTEDETYTLQVNSRQAVLRATTVVGALRGLETLLQLVEGDAQGYYIPCAEISDQPRFPWRGLLVDVGRHFEPPEVIKRTLDAMAAVKLNVFHWHLSEDQGFRIESRRYPKLQELGSDGLYYTQQEVREIVAYARDRGIRVVPEFDMPGHATSWFVGYPRYASAPGPYSIARDFGIFDAAFDPAREEVYRFLHGFIAEMAPLFPDAFWHIGGDENNGKQWDANPRIQTFMRRHQLNDNGALQAYFNRRLSQILHKHGKRMMGWDEILHPDLPKNVVVQSWRGDKSLAAGARQGYSGILSAGYYLDAMKPAAFHYAVDPLPATSDLSPEEAARILGGEVCAWGELLTPENIDSRLWPRAAAIAERLWSPREVADVEDMYRRLAFVSVELEALGTAHLSGPERMLRRLAQTDAIEPLRELLRVVQPVSLGERQRAARATRLTPLVALPDIVLPDPAAAREVARWIGELLRDTPRYAAHNEALAREFRRWRELRPALAVLAERAPAIRDAEGAAAALDELGAAGQESLDYLSKGATPPKEWAEARAALLDRAAKPQGLLRIAVAPAMRELITAAAKAGGASTADTAPNAGH